MIHEGEHTDEGREAEVILVFRLPVLCNAKAAGVSVLGIIFISSSLPVVVREPRACKVLGGEGRRQAAGAGPHRSVFMEKDEGMRRTVYFSLN